MKALLLADTPGQEVPTAKASREEMLPYVSDARDTIRVHKANDLVEMIFGEDA